MNALHGKRWARISTHTIMKDLYQSLWNFTPLHVHTVNNNTLLLEELTRLKHETRLRRREYWEQQRLNGLDTKNDLQNYAILSK